MSEATLEIYSLCFSQTQAVSLVTDPLISFYIPSSKDSMHF